MSIARPISERSSTPSMHCRRTAHGACFAPSRLRAAAKKAVHLEWFFDHVRIESMLFDGAARAGGGKAAPADDRPGFGLRLKEPGAQRFAL